MFRLATRGCSASLMVLRATGMAFRHAAGEAGPPSAVALLRAAAKGGACGAVRGRRQKRNEV